MKETCSRRNSSGGSACGVPGVCPQAKCTTSDVMSAPHAATAPGTTSRAQPKAKPDRSRCRSAAASVATPQVNDMSSVAEYSRSKPTSPVAQWRRRFPSSRPSTSATSAVPPPRICPREDGYWAPQSVSARRPATMYSRRSVSRPNLTSPTPRQAAMKRARDKPSSSIGPSFADRTAFTKASPPQWNTPAKSATGSLTAISLQSMIPVTLCVAGSKRMCWAAKALCTLVRPHQP